MLIPLSWLREYVDAPTDPVALERALVKVGLEVEEIVDLGANIKGDLVVGRVASIEELTEFKKPIRFCLVDVGQANGTGELQEIICGARNFAEGDLIVAILPGGELPGGFQIGERKTYGRMSRGMICSGSELGIADTPDGIIVLPAGTASPGANARPLVGLDEVVIELNVTPDRGYCFSIRGVARELASSLGIPLTDPAAAVAALTATASPAHPARIDDPTGCDRFAGAVLRGLDPAAASPEWLSRRLAAAGLRSISLAVDVTNYVMWELGQPMHAYDLAKLQGDLVIRRAAAGEQLTTLDGVKRKLDPADLVIADDSGVIGLAAVMGGASTEVSAGTVDVLLEAAHWEPIAVAKSARRHKLPSEASRRFERGVDPQLPLVALRRAADLLIQYGGGTLDSAVLDLNTVRPPTPITMTVDRPSRTAGVPYSPERVTELLAEVGCTVVADGDQLSVTPPTWRPDLTDPADLCEEVIRLDGYDRVPSVLPIARPGQGLTASQRRRRAVARALAEAGFVETLCYPFVAVDTADLLGFAPEDPRRRVVRLANPLSEQEPVMRTSLLPPLLAALRRNGGRGNRDLALYEIGMVFQPATATGAPASMGVADRPSAAELAAAQEFVPLQPWHVAALLTGDVEQSGWWGPGRPATWADAVEAARTALAAAGVSPSRVTVQAASVAPWHPGRCAELLVDGVVVGQAGELDPAVCTTLEVPSRTCAMELSLDALPLPAPPVAPSLSAFPPALIDVALLVDADVPAATVHAALAAGAGELLESVRLFDVYDNAQALGEGRRSLAFKLTFRAADRTLTADEAVAARDAAVAEAARLTGATLRGA